MFESAEHSERLCTDFSSDIAQLQRTRTTLTRAWARMFGQRSSRAVMGSGAQVGDEEADEDFAKQLRAQLKMNK